MLTRCWQKRGNKTSTLARITRWRSPNSGQLSDRRTHTPPQEENMITTIPHSVTSASTNRSGNKNIGVLTCPRSTRVSRSGLYSESVSRKPTRFVRPSENNKRLIFPQHVRHFGFPLMAGECIMGRASAAARYCNVHRFFQTFEFVGRAFSHHNPPL